MLRCFSSLSVRVVPDVMCSGVPGTSACPFRVVPPFHLLLYRCGTLGHVPVWHAPPTSRPVKLAGVWRVTGLAGPNGQGAGPAAPGQVASASRGSQLRSHRHSSQQVCLRLSRESPAPPLSRYDSDSQAQSPTGLKLRLCDSALSGYNSNSDSVTDTALSGYDSSSHSLTLHSASATGAFMLTNTNRVWL